MPRSPLVLNPLDPGRRLAYIQKFTESLYEDSLSPAEWAREAKSWWAGLGERGLRRYSSGDVLEAEARMLGWDLEDLRKKVRGDIQHRAMTLPAGSPIFLLGRKSQLVCRTAPDGQAYFVQEVIAPRNMRPAEFRSLLVDEFTRQLEGLSPEILGVCKNCERVFVRQRARRREYCSDRCRSQAAMKRAPAAHRPAGQSRRKRKAVAK